METTYESIVRAIARDLQTDAVITDANAKLAAGEITRDEYLDILTDIIMAD